MAITLGHTVRLSAVAENFNGEEVVTTWDVRVATAGSGGNTGFQQDAVEFIEDIYSHITGYVSATVLPERVEFYSRTTPDYLPPLTWGGTTFSATGQELPANACAYMVFPTSQRGVRGRKFIFNTVETNNVGGLLDGTYQTALLAAGQQFIDGDTYGNGWVLEGVVWSTVNSLAYLPVDVTVPPQWGTTTRRKTGN